MPAEEKAEVTSAVWKDLPKPQNSIKTRPTIVFATMCKNEEHCIRDTLESVYKYIDTWVVHDTGSTDNTCNIITDFFKEKGIPGELYCEEWKGFDYNKTKMFEKCYKKSDYILHIDADDLLVGDFNFDVDSTYDAYHLTTKRHSLTYSCIIMWRNTLKWKWCSVAHTIVRCLDKETYSIGSELVSDKVYVHSRDTGSRSFDPLKYLKDANRLKEQFFNTLYNDPDGLNQRSAFYTAQSYMDSEHFSEAIQWYSLYTKLKDTWIEEVYISYISIAKCLIKLKSSPEEVENVIKKAINTIQDRAEAYYIMGKYYNDNSLPDKGYSYLKDAFECNYAAVCKKYILFINGSNYGKYVKDELSVSCFWTNRGEEGYKLLNDIIDDIEFIEHKERLLKNKEHFKKKYNY
jgi:hypothetical protein